MFWYLCGLMQIALNGIIFVCSKNTTSTEFNLGYGLALGFVFLYLYSIEREYNG